MKYFLCYLYSCFFVSVLLCTDHVLNCNLNVTDATLLIHYSLPKSWTHFAQRFSCLLDNYSSPLNAKKSVSILLMKHLRVQILLMFKRISLTARIILWQICHFNICLTCCVVFVDIVLIVINCKKTPALRCIFSSQHSRSLHHHLS